MENKYRRSLRAILHDSAIFELRLFNMEHKDKVITYNSVLYLDIIQAKNGEYTACNIADLLHVSRPSVTQKINELESAGYIIKTQSETDKRVYYLSVTDKYNTIYDTILGESEDHEDEMIASLRSRYSESEVDQFFDMLGELNRYYLSASKQKQI